MTDIYSPVLGAATAMAVGTLVCAISAKVSRSAHLGRLVQVGSILTLLGLAIAVVSHVRIGHSPGSPESLGLTAFVGEHPMVAVVALAAVILFVLGRRQSRGTL